MACELSYGSSWKGLSAIRRRAAAFEGDDDAEGDAGFVILTLLHPLIHRAALGAIAMLLCGCASAPERPAKSSYACMAAVRAQVPSDIPDKRAHCLVAGGIAQRCSVTEARLAGVGKELRDVFTRGDASWADWRADRAGIACAGKSRDAGELAACCASVE